VEVPAVPFRAVVYPAYHLRRPLAGRSPSGLLSTMNVSTGRLGRKAEGMKRIIGASIAAIVYVVVLPLAALAQEGSSLGGPEGPLVGGTGGSIGGAGGTAFTGAEIAGLALLAVGLLVVGIALVVFSRRRTSASRIEA
jgi:LPXTG-motif cell wall-anchored protein